MIGITGYKGVLGSLTTKKLTELQIQFSVYEGDVRNDTTFYNWLVNSDINVIVNYAAIVPVNKVNQDIINAYDVNVGGIIQMLKAIHKTKRPVYFFHASSSHVYKSKNSPIKETDLLEPISTYGEIKLQGEKILMAYAKHDKFFKLAIGRIFSFYHELQASPFLYPTILKRLNTEDLSLPFLLRGAHSIRDFLRAEDVVNYIYRVAMKEYAGVINIGSGHGISIKEFVQSISKTQLDIKSYEDDTFDILVSDNSLLKYIINE